MLALLLLFPLLYHRYDNIMKHLIILSIFSLFTIVLSGCDNAEDIEAAVYIKDEAVKEALIEKQSDYYQNHQEELKVKIDECRALPRQDRKSSPDCKAASRAQSMLHW